MAKGGFTAIAVANAKPARDGAGALMRTELPDRGCKGLYLIIQPGGARSWAVRYRYKGKPRKLTLGPALVLERGEAEPGGDPAIDGSLTLAAARMVASDALRKVGQGTDPAEQSNRKKRTPRRGRPSLPATPSRTSRPNSSSATRNVKTGRGSRPSGSLTSWCCPHGRAERSTRSRSET
jgi:hypothetical protein